MRKSGIELLRILGIFCVISIHACGIIENLPVQGAGAETVRLLNCLGNVGVSIFILISGYFGVKRDWLKIIRLELMVVFYSVCAAVLMRLVWPQDYPRSEILLLLEQSVLPVLTRKHWYFTCYICLLVFAPYINLPVEKLSRKGFGTLILLGYFLFGLAPTFLRFEIMRDGGKGLVNMILLYYIGRYIRLYADWKMKRGACILLLTVFLGLAWISTFIPVRTMLFALDFLNDYSFTMTGIAVTALYLFKDVCFTSKGVNRIAAHVFGIYILNEPVMRLLNVWIFHFDENKTAGKLLPLWLTALIFAVFICCLILDVLRQSLLGKTEKVLAGRIREAAGAAIAVLRERKIPERITALLKEEPRKIENPDHQ